MSAEPKRCTKLTAPSRAFAAWYSDELDRLEGEASRLAREYYAWLKSTGDLVELWAQG